MLIANKFHNFEAQQRIGSRLIYSWQLRQTASRPRRGEYAMPVIFSLTKTKTETKNIDIR